MMVHDGKIEISFKLKVFPTDKSCQRMLRVGVVLSIRNFDLMILCGSRERDGNGKIKHPKG